MGYVHLRALYTHAVRVRCCRTAFFFCTHSPPSLHHGSRQPTLLFQQVNPWHAAWRTIYEIVGAAATEERALMNGALKLTSPAAEGVALDFIPTAVARAWLGFEKKNNKQIHQ